MAFLPNSFLKRAHRLRTHCFLADGLRFRRCLFLSWLLLRRFLLRNPSLSQLPRRHHLLAGGSLLSLLPSSSFKKKNTTAAKTEAHIVYRVTIKRSSCIPCAC